MRSCNPSRRPDLALVSPIWATTHLGCFWFWRVIQGNLNKRKKRTNKRTSKTKTSLNDWNVESVMRAPVVGLVAVGVSHGNDGNQQTLGEALALRHAPEREKKMHQGTGKEPKERRWCRNGG